MENPFIIIPLSSISVDSSWNSRKRYDVGSTYRQADPLNRTISESSAQTIDELINSLVSQGQMQPVEVREITGDPDHAYALTFGFRRYLAMQVMAERNLNPGGTLKDEWLREPTIKALVVNTTAEAAFLRNVAENLARKDLTRYEVASACVKLKREYKLTGNAVADKLDLSRTHVTNLISVMEHVDERILKEWENENPVCAVDRMLRWASCTKEDQIKEFEELTAKEKSRQEAKAAGVKVEKAVKTEKEKQKEGRPNTETVQLAAEAVKAMKDKSKEWKQGALAALAFAAGQTRTVGEFDADEAIEAQKKAKHKEKMMEAAKKAEEAAKRYQAAAMSGKPLEKVSDGKDGKGKGKTEVEATK